MIQITDGKSILNVTERAFDVIYKTHGFRIYNPNVKVNSPIKKETSNLEGTKKPSKRGKKQGDK